MTILTKSIAPQRAPAASAIAAAVVSLGMGATAAQALSPIEELGKNVFFDDKLSHPSHKQACASCHDPAWGWTLPNSKINDTTVVAPGAAPHAFGSIKTPTNSYAFYSPPFHKLAGATGAPFFEGGNFWDGRAEGCGAPLPDPPCTAGEGRVSETVTVADLPIGKQTVYKKFLGPTADQALNPFPNTVEQNIREKNVCQVVKTAKYKSLFNAAWGEDINCSTNPKDEPAYDLSFRRVAVALAAWQSSDEVNSFSSKRDKALEADDDGHFPLVGFTPQENLGHDLFYGITSTLNPTGKNARCAGCHNGVPPPDAFDPPDPPDPKGEGKHQLYTDNRFHNIGVPFNREIPDLDSGVKVGLSGHFCPDDNPDCFFSPTGASINIRGMFKTPTLRNVAKKPNDNVVKGYGHNGWFKSLESIVHFYNTRDSLRDTRKCEAAPINIKDATEEEALSHNCWPPSEFGNQAGFVIGRLGLTDGTVNPEDNQEAAIVAYLKTLSDQDKLTPP